MSFLSELFVSIIISYIALTNTLADGVTTLFANQAADERTARTETSLLRELPSYLSSIPDLLTQNATYQQAAVGAGADTSPAVDPLDAIVNLYCTFRTGNTIRTTTGTGFFIDAEGIIMTNAHVAQFLLLSQADDLGAAECFVRTGNPAGAQYTAELLYIPPAWIQENAAALQDAVPMGTGERDYALLYVSGSVTGEPLPARFPALPFSADFLSHADTGAPVTIAGYPANAIDVTIGLIPRQAETNVSELYTFGSNRADVFSIRGSVVGAEGASGSPVINADGAVIGVVVTRGDDAIDGPGSLRAITLSHIASTIAEESGLELAQHLGGNLPLRGQIFAETLSPFLLATLAR